jgi:hypothetical protein
MPTQAYLDFPGGYRAAVWTLLEAAVEADPVYAAADVALVFYDGDPESLRAVETYGRPVLRFLPALGNQAWFDEGSMAGALIVFVEAYLPRCNVVDLMNLQEVLETTLNTVQGVTFQQALVTAGAVTGLVLFTQPLNLARGPAADNCLRATGQFTIEVRRPLLS